MDPSPPDTVIVIVWPRLQVLQETHYHCWIQLPVLPDNISGLPAGSHRGQSIRFW